MAEKDHDNGTIEWLHPLILAARANAEDNPSWKEAMNGPLAEGYWKATEIEIKTLIKNEKWDVVDREPWMDVIPSTWAFKCKRFPDGLVKKLKARNGIQGDRQIQGVDFTETFAPVVSWNTVQLMLIFSQVMNVQVDYVAAFTQAPIDTDVYCEMPQGFCKDGKVLKLKKSLYGLCQSPLNFLNHLKQNPESIGFESQDQIDPCLFISPKASDWRTSTTPSSSLLRQSTVTKQSKSSEQPEWCWNVRIRSRDFLGYI